MAKGDLNGCEVLSIPIKVNVCVLLFTHGMRTTTLAFDRATILDSEGHKTF